MERVITFHLAEPEFNVEKLCAHVELSRMQANRLLKRAYGMSPVAYIKWRRLERAANLIQIGDLSIQEVGRASGFNSPAYFSKCFKLQFGCSPSQFLTHKTKQL